jgi:hypothetical protein
VAEVSAYGTIVEPPVRVEITLLNVESLRTNTRESQLTTQWIKPIVEVHANNHQPQPQNVKYRLQTAD